MHFSDKTDGSMFKHSLKAALTIFCIKMDQMTECHMKGMNHREFSSTPVVYLSSAQP